MRHIGVRLATAAVVLCASIVAVSPARSAERTADQILKEIDAVKLPVLDSKKKTDKSAVTDNQIRRREASLKRARLIRELYKLAPGNKRVPTLLVERWTTLTNNPDKGRYNELLTELESVLSQTKDKKLKIEASYAKAELKLHPASSKGVPDPAGVEDFLDLAPKDPRAGDLIGSALELVTDSQKKASLMKRMQADFPDSDLVGMLQGPHNRTDSIGKPFYLEFTDAIHGTKVSMKGLRGKVVVIDFWATWCPPCVAEMPKMKELYAKFKDQGVEFVGISLDQAKERGGLDSLKTFVKEKGITWPQYYQGKFWNGDFSKSWGVNSIPCVFVVDTEGKLFSVQARGKLEEIIPELLKKKSASIAAAGG